MKMKINHTIGCLLIASAFASCSDYLNESSGDLLIPEKVDEFQSVEKVILTVSQPMWNG